MLVIVAMSAFDHHLVHLHFQLLEHAPSILIGASADPTSAPVGVNPECGIPKSGSNGSLANFANIIACGLSVFVALALIHLTSRRKAAVGKHLFV